MADFRDRTYTIIRHPSGEGWTFRNERNPRHTKEHVSRPSMYAAALYLHDHMHVAWQNIVWPFQGETNA